LGVGTGMGREAGRRREWGKNQSEQNMLQNEYKRREMPPDAPA